MFISQSLNQDSSYQNRVNKLVLPKDEKVSISTSGYCKARARLSTSAISTLTKTISIIFLLTDSIIDANIGTYSGKRTRGTDTFS